VHVEALFGDWCEPRSAGRIANLSVELHAFSFEGLTPAIQLAQRARLPNAVCPACNDARGNEDETNENERDSRASR